MEVVGGAGPVAGMGGEKISVSRKEANNGANATEPDSWADGIYVSTDGDLYDGKGEDWLVFGMPHSGRLEPGQFYTQSAMFTLPPTARGSHIIVETNLEARSILPRDENSILALEEQIDGVLGRAEDVLGGSLADAAPGAISRLSQSDIIFILVGDQAALPQRVFEGPFTDNNARAVASDISNIPPDLIVSQVNVEPTVFSGEPVEVSWTVSNVGVGAVWAGTDRWMDCIFISPDAEFIASRASLAGRVTYGATSPLLSGDSYTQTATVTLPAGVEGRYYVHVFTDISLDRYNNPILTGTKPVDYPYWPEAFAARVWEGEADEANKENNFGSSNAVVVTYRECDLQVTTLEAPATADSGAEVVVEWTVTNQGDRATRVERWSDSIYLSQDESLDQQDMRLNIVRHNGVLEVGDSYSESVTVQLPDNIEGNYFLLAYVDSGNNVKEYRDEGNDITVKPIAVSSVELPDLQVTAVNAPAHVTVGQGYEVMYVVGNEGAGDVPDRQGVWYDRIYLSRDTYLDVRSDHYVGEVKHTGVLAAGSDYSIMRTLAIPRGLLGPYYVFVLTDVPGGYYPLGRVIEGGEGNNATASVVPMLIELPPPADLQVDEIVVPAAGYSGDSVVIEWTASNHSTEAIKGSWVDSAYLSTDAIWDLGDKLIGSVEQGSLGSGVLLGADESYSAQLTALLPATLPESYRIIVRSDIFDDINEGSNNSNNRLASADAIDVSVKTLQLGIAEGNTLATGKSLLYAVEVCSGETLEISLTSDFDNAAHELYVRYEGLPSSIHYDAAYEGHLWADQTISVPSTIEGTYYILARGTSDPSPQTPIELLAKVLPFGITDITPDVGGADRYVTTVISGAKFDEGAIVKLVRPKIAEFEPINYQVVDATEIIATFDLRNAPHGLYDVQVINPDGAVSRIPYRYLVEEALPLDLTVGMGGPALLDIGELGWYGVGVYSLTNVDAPYVHVEFGVPHLENSQGSLIPGELLVFRTTLGGEASVDDVPWAELDSVVNIDGDLIASGFTFDFVNAGYAGVSFSVETYPGLKDILEENPNWLNELMPWELEDLAFDFYIQAAATPMTVDEYIGYQLDVAEQLRLEIIEDTEAADALRVAAADTQTWGDAYVASLADSGLLRQQDEPPETRIRPEFVSLLAAINAGILAGPAGGEIIGAGDLVGFFEQVRLWYGHDDNAYATGEIPGYEKFDLGLTHPTHFEAFSIHVGPERVLGPQVIDDPDWTDFFGVAGQQSQDVQMSGPNGAGVSGMVPLDTPLPYMVSFEWADDSAGVLSQVRIVQQLDSDLDVRSFRLGDIQIGDLFVNIPDGRGAFTGEFDFVDERGMVLRVVAGVDVLSDTATWLLTAIDPDTGLPVTDVDRGLLLPEVASNQEGVVSYTIKADSEAETGAELQAEARVFFNNGAPLDTNSVVNILDAETPVSALTVVGVGAGSYQLDWQAEDDPLGSGVMDYTVYASINGGAYTAWLRRTEETSAVYEGKASWTVKFIVLASDAAGNIEATPEGVLLPSYNPNINLGTLPTAPEVFDVPIPPTEPSTQPVTNVLFIQAQHQIPAGQSLTHRSSFDVVNEPFTASGFAWDIDQSGAGIGPLGMAFAPDGETILISGGEGRNNIYRFNLTGGSAIMPLSMLDVPIYDMVFDATGRLWATTGGGPLVQLDPGSGEIIARYGDGVTLGLAVDPDSSDLYVASKNGIEVFDTIDLEFSPYSSTRVDGLAFGADGSLWAATWPYDGQVVRFDRFGQPEVMLELDEEAEGLTFGLPGTPLEGLLFVTHAAGGALTMVDLASMESVEIATGGSRGDFIHVGPDGRVYITQGDQVDVLYPLTPPHIIATTPVDQMEFAPVINIATVVFDSDMKHDFSNDPNSVINPANYMLMDVSTQQPINIGALTYNIDTRTVSVWFESLPADSYQLKISAALQNEMGINLESSYTVEFSVLIDLSDEIQPQYSNTQFDHDPMMVSFDAVVVNPLANNLLAPIRLVFEHIDGTDAALLNANGLTNDGYPYIELTSSLNAVLAPGERTSVHTVSIANPNCEVIDFTARVVCGIAPNLRPIISSTPQGVAQVGQDYSYLVEAIDPEGGDMVFAMLGGPEGADLDSATGQLIWNPQKRDFAETLFNIRVFDEGGSFSDQEWSIAVEGVNHPPVLLPIGDQVVSENQWLTIPVGAVDGDQDALYYWVDNMPGGAIFDPIGQVIRWKTDGLSAGRYSDVTVYTGDGFTEVSQSFEILVYSVNQPPQLEAPVPRTINEGDTLQLVLSAQDVDGDAVRYSSPNLPVGALLHPDTGVFTWTPGYHQHGSYEIEIDASDDQGSTTQTLAIEVSNVNGQVQFESVDQWIIYEGQNLAVYVIAFDPDNPYGASMLLPDGTMDSIGLGAALTWNHTALPEGAQFDLETMMFRWVPEYDQAGTYSITFSATDNGDSTTNNTTDQTELIIEVRDANAPPVIEEIANQSVDASDTLVFDISAYDVDVDTLVWSVEGLPAFAVLTDNGDNSATITANPVLNDRGNYAVTVYATDSGNGNQQSALTAQRQFILSAVALNAPPVMTLMNHKVAVFDNELAFTVQVADLDEDPLTYSAINLPAGATFVPSSIYGQAEFLWTPTAADAGVHQVTLQVQDSGNGDLNNILTDAVVVEIEVRATNAAPTLIPVGTQDVHEGETLSLQLVAGDPDNDALSFYADQLPAGAVLNEQTGEFVWNVGFNQAGYHNIAFFVTDGDLVNGEDVSITVYNTNRAPVFIPVPELTTHESSLLQIQVAAGDPDEDALTYYIAGDMPVGASFDVDTHTFLWQPDFDQTGVYTISFAARDAGGLSDTFDAFIEVLNVNRAPEMASLSGHVLPIGQTYITAIEADDPDVNSTLEFTAERLPNGAELNPLSGVLTWTPTAAQAGEHNILIT
ncbi:MAG: hypothetical protein GY869_31865, partial [Planctomycetes bacterium]|nr:hypothetical protein [Planctomycetota bacterium]